MGEVYRARDTTLGRDVAIKILPRLFTTDPERRARFDREARLLASLNHPHIGAIYGVEDVDGTPALILELIDGNTLAERIAKAPISIGDALNIAGQIADALEAAHEKGIVHRDLKPANIKITPDAVVKVLDFGLAKAATGDASGPDLTQSPTVTIGGTRDGVILGTAAYMSPEQARGKPVDKRTDVWAFGAVLYEMLAGTRAFGGEDVSETLAFVLTKEPDWTALPANTPESIRRLLLHCLNKDRKRRLADIADTRMEIDEAMAASAEDRVMPRGSAPVRTRVGAITWTLGALVVVLACAVAWLQMRPPSETPQPVVRSSLSVPDPGSAPGGTDSQPSLAISTDGTHIVYASQVGQLYVKALDQVAFVRLSGTDLGYSPVFSPDGKSIAFFGYGQRVLKRVSLLGGAATTITGVDGIPAGIAWGADDTVFFATLSARGGLYRVPGRGGAPERLTAVDEARGDVFHTWPSVLPNGKGVLFTSCKDLLQCHVAVVSLKTHVITYLVAGNYPRYSSTGHIVYVADGAVRAVGFDQGRLSLTTDNPVPVIDGVRVKRTGSADFDLAANGSMVYLPGEFASRRTLVWVNSEGSEQALALAARGYDWVRVSPDGRRVAAEIAGEARGNSLWVSDVTRPTLIPIASDVNGGAAFPFWTPDGSRVVFSTSPTALFSTAADGTSASESLASIAGAGFVAAESWTDGGRTLVFTYGNVGQPHIGLLSLEGNEPWKPLADRATDASAVAISPSGKWLAYQSGSSGQYEVYVERFPQLGTRQRVSTEQGGWAPVWSPDGRRLFYRRGSDGAMMAVPVQTGETLVVGGPTMLFESRGYDQVVPPRAGSPAGRTFDVAPDGRFLMIKESVGTTTEMLLIQHWFEELKRLVPTK